MKTISLDKNNRKFLELEVEVDGEKHILKFFEQNTRQIDEVKTKLSVEGVLAKDIDELYMLQFRENLVGDKKLIEQIFEHYKEKGNIYAFARECDEELGKLLKRG